MSSSPSVPGTQILAGRYALGAEIGLGTGGGAAGQAFLAVDTRTGHQVVVKLSTRAQDTIYQVRTEAIVLDLLRQAFQRSNDPVWKGRPIPIPLLYEGPGERPQLQNDNRAFLVEEYVTTPYVPLPELVARGSAGWSPLNALQLLEALTQLVEFAHANNVIHGDLNDLKVEHVFWDPVGQQLKLIDWGIADHPGVVERRHQRNSDVQGLGTLFHYMLTGKTRSRDGKLDEGWAEEIVQLYLTQDPSNASLAKPKAAVQSAIARLQEQVDEAAAALRTAVADGASPQRAAMLDERVAALARLNPNHRALADVNLLVQGPVALLDALGKLKDQLAEALALFGSPDQDPTDLRFASATAVAERARHLGGLTARARRLDAATRNAFAASLPDYAAQSLRAEWRAFAGAFDEVAAQSIRIQAPNGPRAEPWTSFCQALLSFDLRRAADLLADAVDLVSPNRRAHRLRYLLLTAWFPVHPLTDVDQFVSFAKVWTERNRSSMPARALQEWLNLLDTAGQSLATLARSCSPGDVAQTWATLADATRRLASDAPEFLLTQAPLGSAVAVMDAQRETLAALADAWRGGQYDVVGQLADSIVSHLSELEDALAEWVTAARSHQRRLDLVARVQSELATLAENARGVGGLDPSAFVDEMEQLRLVDPQAPWADTLRAAVRGLVELTRSGQDAGRRLGRDGLAELATVVGSRRAELATVAEPRRLRQAIQATAAALESSERADAGVDRAALASAMADLGPLRPVFERAAIVTFAQVADGAAKSGRWIDAASSFEEATSLAEHSGSPQASQLRPNAVATSLVADACAALNRGQVSRAVELTAEAQRVAGMSSTVAVAVDAMHERVSTLARIVGDLIGGLRAGLHPSQQVATVNALRAWPSHDALKAAPLEKLRTVITACVTSIDGRQPTTVLSEVGVDLDGQLGTLVDLLLERLSLPGVPQMSSFGVAESPMRPTIGPPGIAQPSPTQPRRRPSMLMVALAGVLAVVAVAAVVLFYLLKLAGPPTETPQAARPATTSTPGTSGISSLSAPQETEQERTVREAPQKIQAIKDLLNAPKPEAEQALVGIAELEKSLPQTSTDLRQQLKDLKYRAYAEDAQRRLEIALGSNDLTVLDQSKALFGKALEVKPDDPAALTGQDNVQLAEWRINYEKLYKAADAAKIDERIELLRKIRERRPDYDGAQWSAKEKLYAELIAKAKLFKDQGNDEGAKATLVEAEDVNPDGREAPELTAQWYPTPVPTPVPVIVAPPVSRPTGGGAPPATKPSSGGGGPVSKPSTGGGGGGSSPGTGAPSLCPPICGNGGSNPGRAGSGR
ncbi:MAG: hypothetical protein U0893_27295 [Chloroflexota bacterium]